MAAEFKALLVAAGTGTRLRPLTEVLPKCLMPINGMPLLGIWLELLRAAGAAEIIVNTHHHAALVREFVARSPYARLVTLAHEETLLGTAGTLMRHRDRLRGGTTFFVHADNLALFDMAQFLAAHRARPAGTMMTMMTFMTDTPELCGIVRLDERGRIAEFHEKSPHARGNLANAAVYLLEPEIFGLIEARGRPVADFSTDVLPFLLDRIHTFHNDVYHRDIGTPASLAKAQADFSVISASKRDAGDPWYGLMAKNGGALARAFAQAVEATYRSKVSL